MEDPHFWQCRNNSFWNWSFCFSWKLNRLLIWSRCLGTAVGSVGCIYSIHEWIIRWGWGVDYIKTILFPCHSLSIQLHCHSLSIQHCWFLEYSSRFAQIVFVIIVKEIERKEKDGDFLGDYYFVAGSIIWALVKTDLNKFDLVNLYG